jgi:hypothetical protein
VIHGSRPPRERPSGDARYKGAARSAKANNTASPTDRSVRDCLKTRQFDGTEILANQNLEIEPFRVMSENHRLSLQLPIFSNNPIILMSDHDYLFRSDLTELSIQFILR